jgi:hypothetical protein
MGRLYLDGPETTAIHEVLTSAFDADDFHELLQHTFGQKFVDRLERKAHRNYVLTAFLKAHRDGRLDELLIAAARNLPTRDDVLSLVLRFCRRPGWTTRGATHVNEAAGALERLTTLANPFLNVTAMARWLVCVERQVCQVRCGNERGTGFLVAPDLVLTCFHVVEPFLSNRVTAADVQVRFDYREDFTGAAPDETAPWLPINPTWEIPKAPYGTGDQDLVSALDAGELDYALLRLASAPGNERIDDTRTRGWIHLDGDAALPIASSPALCVQHPGREQQAPLQWPLRVAFGTFGAIDHPHAPLRALYQVSTLPGSSGAPVFDGAFRAVALHHNRGARHPDNPQLVIDNRGVPLARVVAHLHADVRALLAASPP